MRKPMIVLVVIIVLAILTIIGAVAKQITYGHALIVLSLLIIAYQGSQAP